MKIALQLPGFEPTALASPVPSLKPEFTDLASILSPLLTIAFYAAAFIAFFFLVWGALSYIMAQGKKEDLAKARARITWALIGFIVIALSFFIAKYISEAFSPGPGRIGAPF